MNIQELIHRLHQTSEDFNENQEIMSLAANALYQMQMRINSLTDMAHRLQDENDKLALDLGLKDRK